MLNYCAETRPRPRDIQATKRDRGNPRNYFKPVDISDIVHPVDEPSNTGVTLKTNESWELPNHSQSNAQLLIPLTEFMPTVNKYNVPYTLDTFFKKNLSYYIAYAKRAGVAKYDAADVVQDAIYNFFEGEKISSNPTFNLITIQRSIKPKLRIYLDACILAYHLEKRSEKAFEKLDILKIKEEKMDNPYLLSEMSNPFIFFVTHRLFDKSEFSPPKEPVSSSAYVMDPIEVTLFRDETQNRVFYWLSTEVLDAIIEVKPELPVLRRKYAFAASPEAFQTLTTQTPLRDEINIADYVAFGANNLTCDDLLTEWLFYSALHRVLREVDFGATLETPQISDVTFLPFGRRMTRQNKLISH